MEYSYSLHIVVFLYVFVLFPTFGESRLCQRRCGYALEAEAEEKDQKKVQKQRGKSYKLRIVNGYEPPPRSFLVLIKINDGDSTCGGTIINDKFVLTAGHCVCLMDSEVIPCEDGKIDYDPEVVKLYIGVNNKDVSSLESLKGVQVLTAKKIIIHEKWDGTGYPNLPDLALIKTNKAIRFKKGIIGPICLPKNENVKVHNKKVYAGGWGVTGGSCLTNDDGPEKHVRCRKPFSYDGQIFDGCLTSESPSSDNRICGEFLQSVGRATYDKKTHSTIKIIYGKNKSTSCYRLENQGYGWCGTCRREAVEGESGYCSPFDDYQPEDETMTDVRTTKGWGFCTKQCSSIDLETSKLQEIGLRVLYPSECDALVGDSEAIKYMKSIEVCAGYKLKFPKKRVYRRYKVKGIKHKFVFRRRKSEKNRLGISGDAAKLNFYLGHADSCQGDSGGPLYRFAKKGKYKRAVLVGVVSRGEQCAGLNQPGIYTNSAKFIKWIRQQTKSGKCNFLRKKN